MTEQQATSDTTENTLAFELWELVAPRINRELPEVSPKDGEEEEKQLEMLDKAYITEMQSQEVTPADLKTVIMAILRINDGKHFFNANESPLP